MRPCVAQSGHALATGISHRLTLWCNTPPGAATYEVMSSEPDASVLRRLPGCFALPALTRTHSLGYPTGG